MRGALVRATPVARLKAARPLTDSSGQDAVRLAAVWSVRLLVLGALLPIGIYLWVAAHRLAYPYELDWIENGGVNLAGRVLSGQSLYTAPTLAYVSYTYTPLYPVISAVVAEITGLGFLPLRLVSFGSSLLIIGLLWRWVSVATRDRVAAVVAAGLFAATYGLTGWWFDVGRLDSLFVALTIAALWLARGARGIGGGVAAGLIAFLAFFTKQIGLVAVLPALVYLVVVRPRAGVAALLTLIVTVAGSTVILDAITDGWYRYYVVNELAGQAWVQSMWLGFWRGDLFGHLELLTLLLLAAVFSSAAGSWRRGEFVLWAGGRPRRPETIGLRYGYELSSVCGLLLAAWFSRLHSAGYLNVLMPAYAGCALLGGLAFASLRRLGSLATLAAAAVVLIQIGLLVAVPSKALPTRTESTAGAELIAKLRSLPGPILVLGHPWYGTELGKGAFAQADAIKEVLRSDAAPGHRYLEHALQGSLNRYHVQAVVLDGAPPSWLTAQLARDFVLEPGPITSHPLSPPSEPGSAPTSLYLRVGAGRG